jgi:hypothetical protein
MAAGEAVRQAKQAFQFAYRTGWIDVMDESHS